ncbi:hypothetical protein UAJ10_22780 [Nitrospirillum sp. BR 11164]|uniref:hypothetical protein n=1 Tax=Nitrospirillum sp. BR 11164 TaxID=3104324 RepID=UPI002AFDDA62|nr:hypothetical protein [Nitrospirillum sp. BR 11164]MEA1651826.1 hypothetical protein [Nitrospirillum sp. BR 11164]
MSFLDDDVVLAFDPDFGERLSEIAGLHPVWVCQSPANSEAAEQLWAKGDQAHQVTVFTRADMTSPENAFVSLLDTIDQHHPAWRRLSVFGCQVTPAVREALADYGGSTFEEMPGGFAVDRGAVAHG